MLHTNFDDCLSSLNQILSGHSSSYFRAFKLRRLFAKIWLNYRLRFIVGLWNMMRCRLQQLTEFDCFVKSFTYLAARLPRSEFLEPFLDEATIEPVENVKKQMAMLSKMKDVSAAAEGVDMNALMLGIQQAIGKPSEAALRAGDVPLSEAESDMYPCLLALCGSGYGFMKVKCTLLSWSAQSYISRKIIIFISPHRQNCQHFSVWAIASDAEMWRGLCVYICLFGTPVSPAKTDEPIEMPLR